MTDAQRSQGCLKFFGISLVVMVLLFFLFGLFVVTNQQAQYDAVNRFIVMLNEGEMPPVWDYGDMAERQEQIRKFFYKDIPQFEKFIAFDTFWGSFDCVVEYNDQHHLYFNVNEQGGYSIINITLMDYGCCY